MWDDEFFYWPYVPQAHMLESYPIYGIFRSYIGGTTCDGMPSSLRRGFRWPCAL